MSNAKPRTWRKIHLTQLRTEECPALAGFCIWYSDRGEQLHPCVSGLGGDSPVIEGWKLVAAHRKTGELEVKSYHLWEEAGVEAAKQAARERTR